MEILLEAEVVIASFFRHDLKSHRQNTSVRKKKKVKRK